MDAPITESFDLPKEGRHQAFIEDVIDAGTESSKINGKPRPIVDIVFVLDERNEDDEPMRVIRRVTRSINKHTFLGRLLVAVKVPVDFKAKGTDFKGFDTALRGKRLVITIQHKEKGQSTFPDIVAFSDSLTPRAVSVASLVADAEGL